MEKRKRENGVKKGMKRLMKTNQISFSLRRFDITFLAVVCKHFFFNVYYGTLNELEHCGQ